MLRVFANGSSCAHCTLRAGNGQAESGSVADRSACGSAEFCECGSESSGAAGIDERDFVQK